MTTNGNYGSGGSGFFIMDSLYCVMSSVGLPASVLLQASTPFGATGVIYIHDCYLDCGSLAKTTGLKPNGGDGPFTVQNIKIWNATDFGFVGSGQGGSAIKILKNISIYQQTVNSATRGNFFLVNGSNWTVDNCVGIRSNVDLNKCWDSGATGTFTSCADDDGTCYVGTGIQHNITQADEFKSLDPTSSDFLKLKTTGVLAAGGVDASIAADIIGTAIPQAGKYSIGCYQAIFGATGNMMPFFLGAR
jgi:hypothetical protein